MKFYNSVPVPTDEVMKLVYAGHAHIPKLEERLPNDGKCEVCLNDEWLILPLEEGQKPYIRCMDCGLITHL